MHCINDYRDVSLLNTADYYLKMVEEKVTELGLEDQVIIATHQGRGLIKDRDALNKMQAANKELMESQSSLENEMKLVKINYESARVELETFKNALRDIRSEAVRTSGRVRQRYFTPKGRK